MKNYKLGVWILLTWIVLPVGAQETAEQPQTLPQEKEKKERMVICEPSILMNVIGGATYLDAQWKNEFNLDVSMGVQFRKGHAAYVGMTMQQMQRTKDYKDRRTSRTNMPVYLLYQWRCFGWHKEMADVHTCSPYLGVKAGWNFLQDVFVDEGASQERMDDLKNNYFLTPQIGFDWRIAEYMAFGVVVECEVSRRYVGDSDPVNKAAWLKPRIGLGFRF